MTDLNNPILSNTQKSGKIKWYNNIKGFGFITGDNGEEAFLHYSVIKNLVSGEEINEGDHVLYETRLESRGLMAVNVYLQKELSLSKVSDGIRCKENIPSDTSNKDEYSEEIKSLKNILFQRCGDLNNPRIVKGILADCVVDNKALRNVLTCLYDEGIVEKLYNAVDLSIEKHKLLKNMINQYGYNERYAEIGVNIWADILNDIKAGGYQS